MKTKRSKKQSWLGLISIVQAVLIAVTLMPIPMLLSHAEEEAAASENASPAVTSAALSESEVTAPATLTISASVTSSSPVRAFYVTFGLGFAETGFTNTLNTALAWSREENAYTGTLYLDEDTPAGRYILTKMLCQDESGNSSSYSAKPGVASVGSIAESVKSLSFTVNAPADSESTASAKPAAAAKNAASAASATAGTASATSTENAGTSTTETSTDTSSTSTENASATDGDSTESSSATTENADGSTTETSGTKTDTSKDNAQPTTYSVTYTDGVDSETVFEDVVLENLVKGSETPAYPYTPERTGYKFTGWTPEVAETVTENAVYTATWEKIPQYTVTYTDGVADEVVFADQKTTAYEGAKTPAFNGTPAREGYNFTGWTPSVSETVTKNATYTATWQAATQYTVKYTDGVSNETVFTDQIYKCELNAETPLFVGTPSRTGYTFKGWSPTVAKKVTKDATYTAVWYKNDSYSSQVNNVTAASLPLTTQAQFQKTAAAITGGTYNIAYVDISLSRTDSLGSSEAVTETSKPQLVSLNLSLLPGGLTDYTTFYVLRLHDGVVTQLNATYDAASTTLSFYSDKFSTYGIVYVNKKQNNASSNGGAQPTPSTPTNGNAANTSAAGTTTNNAARPASTGTTTSNARRSPKTGDTWYTFTLGSYTFALPWSTILRLDIAFLVIAIASAAYTIVTFKHTMTCSK